MTFNSAHILTNDKYWSMLKFCHSFHFSSCSCCWAWLCVPDKNACSTNPIVWRYLFAHSKSFQCHWIRCFIISKHYQNNLQFDGLYFVSFQWRILDSESEWIGACNQVNMLIKYVILKLSIDFRVYKELHKNIIKTFVTAHIYVYIQYSELYRLHNGLVWMFFSSFCKFQATIHFRTWFFAWECEYSQF